LGRRFRRKREVKGNGGKKQHAVLGEFEIRGNEGGERVRSCRLSEELAQKKTADIVGVKRKDRRIEWRKKI